MLRRFERLMVRRNRALSKQAMIDEQEKRNRQMQGFFDSHQPEDLYYEDEYVRKLIDEIRVEPTSFRVKFKSGTTIAIPA